MDRFLLYLIEEDGGGDQTQFLAVDVRLLHARDYCGRPSDLDPLVSGKRRRRKEKKKHPRKRTRDLLAEPTEKKRADKISEGEGQAKSMQYSGKR
ncbi:hypothetical protein PsorP6_015250 [Peronosclerospora sorghi]|uniref:Uncharacterized protein n=1 Tax=Peronosclerospora sorghi TaxID=230839 RepID=A0ACC0VSZ8_9STRA|nr:hypothetical protein PsorP6_015250 [Peronosclerospora sorghi]